MTKEETKPTERKRGSNITLLERNISGDGNHIFHVVADETCNLRTEADVKKWMNENGSEGTLYPVRFMKPVTRKVKTVGTFE